MVKKWMQAAVHKKKKGTFTRYMKKHGGGMEGIQSGLKSRNSTTRHRAQFALAARHIAAKHKRAKK